MLNLVLRFCSTNQSNTAYSYTTNVGIYTIQKSQLRLEPRCLSNLAKQAQSAQQFYDIEWLGPTSIFECGILDKESPTLSWWVLSHMHRSCGLYWYSKKRLKASQLPKLLMMVMPEIKQKLHDPQSSTHHPYTSPNIFYPRLTLKKTLTVKFSKSPDESGKIDLLWFLLSITFASYGSSKSSLISKLSKV